MKRVARGASIERDQAHLEVRKGREGGTNALVTGWGVRGVGKEAEGERGRSGAECAGVST